MSEVYVSNCVLGVEGDGACVQVYIRMYCVCLQ